MTRTRAPKAPDVIAWAGPDTLRDLLVPIADLTHYVNNPRRGDTALIAASLATHGQYKPITVNVGTLTGRPNEVLAGNHTMDGATATGWTHIARTLVDVDDDTAAKIVLVDNRAADAGRYDDEDLSALLQSLADAGGLDGSGYEQDDLDDLLDLLAYRDMKPLDEGRGGGAAAAARAGGVAADPGLVGMADAYADKATRPVILDYALADYDRIQGLLATARDQAAVATNSAAVEAALTAYVG